MLKYFIGLRLFLAKKDMKSKRPGVRRCHWVLLFMRIDNASAA